MAKKLTTEEFIQKAKTIHGEKYDYSMVQYCGSHTKVKIICPVHGEFEQKPNDHLCGKGCKNCGFRKSTTEKFISRSVEIFGNTYDYSKVVYLGSNKNVKIICPTHGEFEQVANSHLSGHGCQQCSIKTQDVNKFIENSITVHGLKYDYSLVEYKNANTKVKIICPKHGIFEQKPKHHFNNKIGCKLCFLNSNESTPCTDISKLLENITYEKEKRFDDCRNIKPLPFDFYVPSLNLCIEYDGIQHFKPIEFWGGHNGFVRTQINDSIKTQYCIDNKINLLRIRYDEDHVSVLKEYFKSNFNIEL